MSLKEIKIRINSVKSTRQITSAMKMVASAKLHRAEERIAGMLPYQQQLQRIVTNFLATDATFDSPYTAQRQPRRTALIVFTSNSSLCGAYNSNVLRRLRQLINQHEEGVEAWLLYPVGKKAEEALSKWGKAEGAAARTSEEPSDNKARHGAWAVAEGSHQRLAEKPQYGEAAQLAGELMQRFASGEIDRVELLYYHFKSKGVQQLVCEPFLPIDLTALRQQSAGAALHRDYIVEPSVGELLSALLPKMLSQQIYTVALDANASEHAARTLAMQTATDNANELLQELTKQYNKTRQQAITNELLDLVAGSMK